MATKFKQYKRLTEKIYKVPSSITDIIPINRISENGIFELEAGNSAVKLYDRVYLFEDMNYHTRDDEEKVVIQDKFKQLLSSLNVSFKIIISNTPADLEELNHSVFEHALHDSEELLAREFNRHYHEKSAAGQKKTKQVRYFVISCLKADFESAKSFFTTIENQLTMSFQRLGSGLIPLNATQRLRALHNFYRMGKEKEFSFSWDEALKQRRDWRRDIINTTIREHETYLDMDFGRRFVSVLFVRKYPSGLSDTFLQEMMSLPFPLMITEDIEPVDTDYAEKMLMQKYMSAQRSIDKQQERKNKSGNWSTDVSYDKRKEVEELEEAMDDLRSFDEKMFYVDMLLVVNAASKEALDNYVEQVKTVGSTYTLQIEEHIVRQLDALNTALPTAARFVNTMRPLFTTPLSGFMPFNVQEINDKGGFFYGINQVSKNPIVGNRKLLKNGNGFFFGRSGSGKSQDAKAEIGQVFTYTDDDIIIIDPMGEYEPVVEEWKGSYYKFSQKDEENRVYKNPLNVPKQVDSEAGFISEKAEFLYALCEQAIKPDILTNKHINVIDRATKEMYEEFFTARHKGENPVSPTLVTLRDKFIKFSRNATDKAAADMAEQMEIFTTGTLNIFSHQESITGSSRLEAYGFSQLGKKMKKLAMLVAIEAVKSKLKYNYANKKATWVYVDEIHELWKDEYSRIALEELWREVRKQGGLCTGMTQFIMDGLSDDSTASMIGNSEFTLLLEQGSIDKENLFDVFEVSAAQLKYVNGVDSGTGLVRFGKKIIPFDNIIDRNNDLYRLFNTSFHENEEAEV